MDILINNAGLMNTKFLTSAQGFESTFASNHLGIILYISTKLIKAIIL